MKNNTFHETETCIIRNLEARDMKQRSKKFAHKNDRRAKDARKSWRREEW